MNCITDVNKCLDHLTQIKTLYKEAGRDWHCLQRHRGFIYTFYVWLGLKEMQAGTFITWQRHKDQAKHSAVSTVFSFKSFVKMLRVAAAAAL